jgi:hypothetical protein
VHDLTNIGNLIEAALWTVISLVFACRAATAEPSFRRVFAMLAAAFLVFGISDLIESRTGAWWRPPWLFVMKAACVLVFVWGFRRYYLLKKNRF